MKILALGALVALASGCFASADEVSARELVARRRAAAVPDVSLVGAAYDDARGRLVIVGAPDTSVAAVHTWEWDGARWARRDTTGPSARDEPLVAYDRARHVVLLHGGQRGATALADTWAWDGTRWRRLAESGPPARLGSAMTYDARRGRMVLFGGSGAGGRLLDDLWEWDGARWRQVVADGASGSPPVRALHGLAFDERRGRVVLMGGFAMSNRAPVAYDDTWEWDGARWSRVQGAGPGARDHVALAYVPTLGGVVAHAGGTPQKMHADSWLFDGRAWRHLADGGPPRGRHRLVFDARARRLLLYGGWEAREKKTDLWAFDGTRWSPADQ